MIKQPVENPAIEQIDFSKYRTPELVKTISELLSVRDKAGQIALWSAVLCLVVVAGLFVLVMGNVPLLIFVIFVAYSVPMGLFSGIFLGGAEMVRRSVDGLLSIVDLLLEETGIIARDVRDLRTGDQELPPPGVLVDAVYRHLIYPIIEDVVRGSFGFLGRPILWFYRSTLDRLVKMVIRRFVPSSYDDIPETNLPAGPDGISDEQRDLAVTKGIVEAANTIADHEDRFTVSLNWTRGKVKGIGGWLKLLIVLPFYALFAAVFLLGLLPIVILYLIFASTGTDPGEIALHVAAATRAAGHLPI